MRFSFRSFAIGFGCAALSLGAVTYANAAGDATLKACANKTSGAMRYISKGSCKKTEKLLIWNQMGPQGLPGIAGENGIAGTKGDAGAAGSNGTAGTNGAAGTNGQNLYLVNAEGKTLGQITSADYSNATVLIENYLWTLSTQTALVASISEIGSYFKDAACTIPYGTGNSSVGINANSQLISIDYGDRRSYDSSLKIYKFIGKGLSFSSTADIYRKSPSCTALSSTQRTYAEANSQSLWELSEVSVRPDFSWPMTIVAR
jgi:hypothetical protein